MQKLNKKECPRCKSLKINIITPVDGGDAIISSNKRDYPKLDKRFYHCQCDECREQFEFWPIKNN